MFEKLRKAGNLTSTSPWFATNWSLEGEEEVRGIWPRLLSVPFLFRQICPPLSYFSQVLISPFSQVDLPKGSFTSDRYGFRKVHYDMSKSEGPSYFHKFGDTSGTGFWSQYWPLVWSAIDWSAVSDNAAPLTVVFAGWEGYRSQWEKKVKVRFKCFCPSALACLMGKFLMGKSHWKS